MIRIFNHGASPSEYMRMKSLFSQVLMRIPKEVKNKMPEIAIIVDPKIGKVNGIAAGHSPPPLSAYFPKKEHGHYIRRPNVVIQHTISLEAPILSKLSDSAVMSVMAHEIAHGWLDEIGLPHLASNERDADSFVRKWGFEEGLAAFNRESKALRLKYGEEF